MAIEDDDQNLDTTTTEQDKVDTGGGGDLDKMLDDFTKQTGRDDGTTIDDPNKAKGTQQDRTQARGKDGKQSTTTDGDTDATRTANNRPIQQTPRQYGTLFRSDQTGAIFDATGRKIADPGMGRRIFDRVHGIYQGMEVEHAALKQKVEALETADAGAKDAGLTIEERAAGTRLMTAWKKDKLGTLNFLLNQATQAGIDVSSIRAGGFDAAAVRQLLADEVAKAVQPFQYLVSQREEVEQQEQMRDAAAQELTEFYEEFPIAQMHAPTLAAIMDKTGYSAREALFSLQAHAAQNGWDMNKPLAPQAQATNARTGGTGTRPAATGSNQRLPSMNGRDVGNGVVVETNSMGSASADASWDDILSDVMTKHGVATQ